MKEWFACGVAGAVTSLGTVIAADAAATLRPGWLAGLALLFMGTLWFFNLKLIL